MAHGNAIVVTESEVLDFFKDVKKAGNSGKRGYTDFEKAVIIETFEKGYTRDDVAKKLHTSTSSMRRFYEDYKKGQP